MERCNSGNSRGGGKLKNFSSLGEVERFRYESIFGFARKVRSEARHKVLKMRMGMGMNMQVRMKTIFLDDLFWKN